MGVRVHSEGGAALMQFEFLCHKEAAGTEGGGTFEYHTFLWSEIASQAARSRSWPLPNQAVCTPEQGSSGSRVRASF